MDETQARGSHDGRGASARAIAAGLALLFSGIFFLAQVIGQEDVRERVWWQPPQDHDPGFVELLARGGDGFIAVQLSEDPLIQRPEAFAERGDGPVYRGVDLEPIWPDLAAYRWQRPAGPYMVWILTGGNASRGPYVLLALSLVAPSIAAWWAAELLQQKGVPGWFGAFVALLPGAYASMQFLGLEMVALAALLWGLSRNDMKWHSLAGLFRETLLIPSLVDLARTRRLRFLIPTVIFLAWGIVVRSRTGGWFFAANTGRLGFLESAWPLLFVVVSFLVRRSRWAPYVWAYAAVSVLLGWEVYLGRHFTRPLLPWFAFVGFAALERFYELRRSEVTHAS